MKMLILLFFAFIILKQIKPKIKGYYGERLIRKHVKKLSLENYKLLNDILIMTSRGTSQIDHIIISPYGLYVIETKNYKGLIYGNEDQESWTQILCNKKFHFQNPIKQNFGHIYALKEALPDFNYVSYYSIVVFVGSALLRDVTSKSDVIYLNDLYNTILQRRGIQQLNQNQVEELYNRIKNLSINNNEIRKDHNTQIKNKLRFTRASINSLICPKCGSTLVVRNSRFGSFYGCTKFPKCKFKSTI